MNRCRVVIVKPGVVLCRSPTTIDMSCGVFPVPLQNPVGTIRCFLSVAFLPSSHSFCFVSCIDPCFSIVPPEEAAQSEAKKNDSEHSDEVADRETNDR